VLRVACDSCNRAGSYRNVDWLDMITADCPKKSNMNDQCGARCPEAAKNG